MERVAASDSAAAEEVEHDADKDDAATVGKLSTSKLARKLGLKTVELTDKLLSGGYLELKSDKPYLTEKGKGAGGEFRISARFGGYFLWPDSLTV